MIMVLDHTDITTTTDTILVITDILIRYITPTTASVVAAKEKR